MPMAITSVSGLPVAPSHSPLRTRSVGRRRARSAGVGAGGGSAPAVRQAQQRSGQPRRGQPRRGLQRCPCPALLRRTHSP